MRVPQVPLTFEHLHGRSLGWGVKTLSEVFQQRATDARGRYLHWDDFRFKKQPEGLNPEQSWYGTKVARLRQLKDTPFDAKDGEFFRFMEPDVVRALLHWIDGKASGNVVMPIPLDNQAIGKSFHVSSLIEEAFSSSRLEGAATTRAVAKAMIREGREPKNKSERMIWNNFQAMEFIGTHKDDALTVEMILELHRIVTKDTLERPEMAGVLRGPNDRIVVEDAEGQVLHDPPPATSLEERLRRLCDYANLPPFGEGGGPFLHPVVQAIILHFMIGYDHPFIDGNGRTARALFYWHVIRHGYWLAQYISISRIMLKAPNQYGRAYLETETDGGDLTYFIIHQLHVFKQSVEELLDHLKQKAHELSALEASLLPSGRGDDFNYRQLELLKRCIEHPGLMITIKEHQRANRISYQTARTDLLSLVNLELLDAREIGKQFIFRSPSNLPARIKTYQRKARKQHRSRRATL